MTTRLVVLWLAVGIPLIWGVEKTLENALKLFQ
ncbi:MFS transporter small subunit [Aliidongia dinghuensis]